jgi:DMSO/TMAO reductase YedYZ heme-binding membrane subunit
MNIQQFRKFHRTVALIVLLPLVVTVFTGVSYRLGKSWIGLSRDQVHFLMEIHEGEYLGQTLEPFYVLFNGLGLLWMIGTGFVMLWQTISRSPWFRQLTRQMTTPKQEEPGDL